MSFNAGSIDSRLVLDRTQFSNELRSAKADAKRFSDQRITPKLGIDRADFKRELRDAKNELDRFAAQSGAIKIKIDGAAMVRLKLDEIEQQLNRLTRGTHTIRVRVRLDDRGINDLENRLKLLEDRLGGGGGIPAASQRASSQVKKDFGIMRYAIEMLVPLTVPVIGGLAAIGAGAAAMGVAGVIAIKGITDAIKNGDAEGQKYAAGVRTIKDAFQETERATMRGLQPGFDSSVAKITAGLPAINSLLEGSAAQLGSVVDHLVGGLIGGAKAFGPLIHEVGGYLDDLSARFEKFMTGPKGDNLASQLQQDFEHLVPVLDSLITLVGHLATGLTPVGLAFLDSLGTVTDVLNSLPTGLLQAFITTYLAFRTAVAVTAGINAASAALRGFAASSAAAGAGGLGGRLGGQAGLLGRVLPIIAPYAAAWAAVAIGLNSAANATEKWRTSTDRTKSTIANMTNGLGKLARLDVGGFIDSIGDQRKANGLADLQKRQQSQLDLAGARGLGAITNPKIDLSAANSSMSEQISRAQALGTSTEKLRMTEAVRSAQLAVTTARVKELRQAQNALEASGQKGTKTWADQARQLQVAETQMAKQTGSYSDASEALRRNLQDRKRIMDQYERDVATRDSARNKYATNNQNTLSTGLNQTFQNNTSVTTGAEGLTKYAEGVQKAIEAEQKWTKVSGDNTVEIVDGNRKRKFSMDAYSAALNQANQDPAKAAGILLGHADALRQDQAAAKLAADMQERLSGAIGAAESKYQLTDAQLNVYSSTLGITSEQLAKGQVTSDQFSKAVGAIKSVVDNANTSLASWVGAVSQFNPATATAADKAQLMGTAMMALNGDAISYGLSMSQSAAANQQFVDAFNKMDSAVYSAKKGLIDFHNAGSQPVLSALQQMQQAGANAAAATYQHEVATKDATQAAKDASDVYYNNTRNALINEASQLGITKTEAQKLADRYFSWPKDAKTQIQMLGAEDTNTILNGIGRLLADLTGKNWQAYLGLDTSAADAALADFKNRLKNIPRSTVPIGKPGGTGSRGDSADSARGNMFRSYATGGMDSPNNHVAEMALPSGTNRVWAEPETKGESYIPWANDYRRPRAKAILQKTAEKLGGYAVFETGGFVGVSGTGKAGVPGGSKRGSSSSGSSATADDKWYYYRGRYYQGREAYNEAVAQYNASRRGGIQGVGSGKARGYSFRGADPGQGYGTYQEAYNARAEYAAGQRKDRIDAISQINLGVGGGFDTRAEQARGGKASATWISSQVDKISESMDAARKARTIPNSLLAQFNKDNAQLSAAVKNRDKIADNLAQAKQKLADANSARTDRVNSVRDSFLGQFNIGTSGNGYAYGIQETLRQSVANTEKFGALKDKAQSLGLDSRLVEELENEGPQGAQNLEAIVNGGKSVVSDINANYQKLYNASSAIGADAGKDAVQINKDIAAANKQVADNTKALVAAQAAVSRELSDIAKDVSKMRADVRNSLAEARKK